MIASPDTATPPQPLATSHSRIFPLIGDVAAENGLRFGSCLDIGCANRPCKTWFDNFKFSVPPKCYIGTDTDPALVEQGLAAGIDIIHPFESDREVASDLVIALEVLEHITEEDSPAFFNYCARNTRKLFALTTPNFEYFRGKRPANAELRWIPDHLVYFNPASRDPHMHKQALTPEMLTTYMTKYFEPSSWQWRIYRAWPWKLHDLGMGRVFDLYFKLFAVAWKKI